MKRLINSLLMITLFSTMVQAGTWVDVTANLNGAACSCGNLIMYGVPRQHKVIAGLTSKALYCTTDDGGSWVQLGGASSPNNDMCDIVFDPLNSNIFWESGIHLNSAEFKTTDGGNSFTVLGNGGNGGDSVSVDFTDPLRQTIVCGTHEQSGHIWKSVNGGTSFVDIGGNFPGGTGFSQEAVVLGPNTYLMGCPGTWTGQTLGIWKTTDGGGSWTMVSSTTPAWHPLITSWGPIFWDTGTTGQLLKGSADGSTWSIVNASGANGTGHKAAPIELPGRKIAVLGSSCILISSDDGANWTQIATGMPAPSRGEMFPGLAYDAIGGYFYTFFGDCQSSILPQSIWRYDYMIAGNVILTNLACAPTSITNNLARNVTFSLKAKSKTAGTITNVSLNLSALSGSTGVKMNNISGATLFSYTYLVPAWTSIGTKIVNILAQSSTGEVAGWTNFTVKILPYTGIIVTNMSVTPPDAGNNKFTLVTFNIIAKDVAGSSIASVSLNLTSLGGPSSAMMSSISGGTQWQYVYNVPSRLTPLGIKNVPVLAAAVDGNLNNSHSLNVNYYDGWPRMVKVIYKDSTNNITGTWKGTGTLSEVTNSVSPPAYEGVRQMRYDYSMNNWWDGFGLICNGHGNIDLTGCTNMTIAYQGPTAGHQLYLQMITITNTSGHSYSHTVNIPYQGTMKETNIPLSAFLDGGVHPVDFTRFIELDFGITGANTGTGTIYFDYITFAGADQTNAVVPCQISVAPVSITPAKITNHKNNTVVLTCKALATNGTITSLVANFSALGGPSSMQMTNLGASNYRCSMVVGPSVTSGSKTVTILATDNYNNQYSVNVTVTVIQAQSRIWTRGLSVSPTLITNTHVNNLTISLFSGTTNGSVVGVYLGLTGLGGPSSIIMSNKAGGTNWSYSFSVLAGVPAGTNIIPVNSVDNFGFTNRKSVQLVVAGLRKVIYFQNVLVSPPLVTNSKANAITVSVFAAESNGALSGVTANFSSIGGPSVAAMTSAGSNWSYTYNAAVGINGGTNAIQLTATDTFGRTNRITGSLVVAGGRKIIYYKNLQVSPPVITNNRANNVTVSIFAAESNGKLSGVFADVSSLGGPSSLAMTASGSNWSTVYNVASGIPIGTNTIQVSCVDMSGKTNKTSGVLVVAVPRTNNMELYAFHIIPNPLILSGQRRTGKETVITYLANPDDEVTFEVYTIVGQSVASLKGDNDTGTSSWDGKNSRGKLVSSGMYLIFMRVNGSISGKPVKFGFLK